MTDSDRMLVWLRAAMDAAQHDAEAAGDEQWRAVDTPTGPEVHVGAGDDVDGKWYREGMGVDAAYRCDDPYDDCDEARRGYLAEARLIAAHAHPAAVLRRIAADRKLLDLHTTPHTVVDGFCVEEGARCTHRGEAECVICGQDGCDTVRLLAEGWGWTEETT